MSTVPHPSKKETLVSPENREPAILAFVVALHVTKHRIYFLRASGELRVMESTYCFDLNKVGAMAKVMKIGEAIYFVIYHDPRSVLAVQGGNGELIFALPARH